MNDQIDQGSSIKMWYIIGIVVIIALAFWYFSASPVQAPTATTSDNTSAAISAEFNQIPDSSAELSQAAAVSAQAVQEF